MSVLDKILRAGEGRAVKALEKIAEEVNSFESKISALSDDSLRASSQSQLQMFLILHRTML